MAKKNLQDIHPLIPILCKAIRINNNCIIDHLNRDNNNDHSHIKDFQNGVRDYLNNLDQQYSGYKWVTEKKANGRKEKDSIDICGETEKECCIIEIDATRIDQIAQKYLSRLCLWGLETEKPLLYIAILYKGSKSHSRIEDCEKYIRYCNNISKKSKGNKSSVIGIYTDGVNIEVWDFDIVSSFQITCPNTESKSFISMVKCAKHVIKWCVNNDKVKDFSELKMKLGKFIDKERRPSKNDVVETKIGKIYVSTDWREYGQRAYWNDFVNCSNKFGVKIEKQVIQYQPDESGYFIYANREY